MQETGNLDAVVDTQPDQCVDAQLGREQMIALVRREGDTVRIRVVPILDLLGSAFQEVRPTPTCSPAFDAPS